MATATRRQMNWTAVTFTPAGGTTIAFTGVTNVTFDNGGSLTEFAGDGDRYNTTKVNDFNEPTVMVECADLIALRSVPVGVDGVFTATHNDAKNGVGAGAITYTVAHCMTGGPSVTGAHRKFGSGQIKFEMFSVDGQTNPLSTSTAGS